MQSYHYTQDVPVVEDADVIVCGGGCSGLAAAIASARNGARTVLLEQYGIVGGNATIGLVGPFMTCYSDDGETQVIKGIYEEIVRRLEELGGAIHPSKVRAGSPYSGFYVAGHDHVTPFDPETLKYVAIQMLQEANVKTYLHTFVVDAITENGKVKGVVAANKSGVQAFHGKVVIDCTADADIAARAGAETLFGRAEDGLVQPLTLFFRIGNIKDQVVADYLQSRLPGEYSIWFSSLIEEARAKGEFDIPRNKIGMYLTLQPGVWRVNTTRILELDPTNAQDLTAAEFLGRQQIMTLMNFFKKYLPGFEDVVLVDSASQVGARESRRIVGKYTLTLEDLVQGTHFADTVSLCGYPVDIHSPTDKGGGLKPEIKLANYYEIPYRVMIPETVKGLIVSGRCISATHEALGAIRIMPSCIALGEAAGTGAAIAVAAGREPGDIDIQLLQTKLLAQNAVLPQSLK